MCALELLVEPAEDLFCLARVPFDAGDIAARQVDDATGVEPPGLPEFVVSRATAHYRGMDIGEGILVSASYVQRVPPT
jgi:hypothetical protein